MRTIAMTVEIDIDDDVLVREAKEYVDDAVQCWGGQFPPCDPFFGDNKTVRVKNAHLVKKPSTKKKKDPA